MKFCELSLQEVHIYLKSRKECRRMMLFIRFLNPTWDEDTNQMQGFFCIPLLNGLLNLLMEIIWLVWQVILLTQGEIPVLPDGYYSTPEDLAKKFNSILAGQLFVDYPRWVVLADKINSYHKKKPRRSIHEFMRTNFGKPWLVISVSAATVLLILTLLQTIFTIMK